MPKDIQEYLIPIGHKLICDCGEEMECITPQATEDFVYSCPKCGKTTSSKTFYPYVEYVTMDEANNRRINGLKEMFNALSNTEKKAMIKSFVEAGRFDDLKQLGIGVIDMTPKPTSKNHPVS